MMEIYLKKPYNTQEKIREAAVRIKQTTVNDVAKEFAINIAEQTLEVTLDPEKMKDIGITDTQIAKTLDKSTSINVKKEEKGSLLIKSKEKGEKSINDVYRLKEKIKESAIAGLKGITQVLPVRRNEEFIIMTAGTNLSEVMQLDIVDSTRTISNDLYEVEAVLGIEAARQLIINEVMKVINEQGLNIDVRHIMLVADTMTASGNVKGITRYGIVGEKASVLARASFETPIRHIINASLKGELDNLSSVVENVMINQPIPIGTGLPGLVTRVKR
jgi:DNA-directed RNA polymerase subunit A"